MTEENVFEHKYKTVQIGCKISNDLSLLQNRCHLHLLKRHLHLSIRSHDNAHKPLSISFHVSCKYI